MSRSGYFSQHLFARLFGLVDSYCVMCVVSLVLLVHRPAIAQTASVTGSVVDGSGAAIGGALVTTQSNAGDVGEKTLTDSLGMFKIQGILPGKYRLTIEKERFETAHIEIEIAAGATSAIRVALQIGTVRQSITVEADSSYIADNAAVATKTDTPLMETPATVEVLPQQVLRDLGLTSSGISIALTQEGVQTRGYAPDTEILIYRGFATSTTLWNGFRIEEAFQEGEGNGGVWMDDVDRLEVLKGPSSILYGRAEPGGAVNVLTKKPNPDLHASLRTGTGSWFDRWGAADVTGALNKHKTLLYRLNLGLEKSDSYLRFAPSYFSGAVAPALTWRITPQTTLSLEGQYRSLSGVNGVSYIPIDPATGRLLPVNMSLTYPRDTVSKFDQYRTMAGLDHRFTTGWSLSWKFLHDSVDSPTVQYIFYTQPVFPISPSGVLLIGRDPYNTAADTRLDATIADLTGHLTAIGIEHTILAGLEYYDYHYGGEQGYDFSANPDYETNYFNPGLFPWSALPQNIPLDVRRRTPAFYAQDQLALPGNLYLLLGGRYQRIHEFVNFVSDTNYDVNLFTPRAGLLWRPRPWISAYYSYAENTGVSNGFEFPDVPLAPEKSKEHELGVKAQWLKDRITVAVAVFDLTKFNIATADPLHPGFNIGLGKVESTGYEFNLQGAITRNWNLLLDYSQARPEIKVGANGANASDGEGIEAGQLLPFVSNRTFSSLTSLNFPWQSMRGLTVGGGVNWASPTNPYPSSTLPTGPYTGYTVASSFTSYRIRLDRLDASVQLNVNNMFDRKYLLNFSDDGSVASGNYGTPRQLKLSLSVGF
jgi:iron complex outermembrane receptor protein